jgi:hypothetical protein
LTSFSTITAEATRNGLAWCYDGAHRDRPTSHLIPVMVAGRGYDTRVLSVALGQKIGGDRWIVHRMRGPNGLRTSELDLADAWIFEQVASTGARTLIDVSDFEDLWNGARIGSAHLALLFAIGFTQGRA